MCKAVVLSGSSSHLCVRACILTSFKAKAIVEGHAVLLLENWEKGRANCAITRNMGEGKSRQAEANAYLTERSCKEPCVSCSSLWKR